mmetsp:Transcript_22777/g.70608  ORF Transcript_22777/g.70608 Transcript_22777/m.70608 type:complete len:230 (-) Transcript_22777:68-757(-)
MRAATTMRRLAACAATAALCPATTGFRTAVRSFTPLAESPRLLITGLSVGRSFEESRRTPFNGTPGCWTRLSSGRGSMVWCFRSCTPRCSLGTFLSAPGSRATPPTCRPFTAACASNDAADSSALSRPRSRSSPLGASCASAGRAASCRCGARRCIQAFGPGSCAARRRKPTARRSATCAGATASTTARTTPCGRAPPHLTTELCRSSRRRCGGKSRTPRSSSRRQSRD